MVIKIHFNQWKVPFTNLETFSKHKEFLNESKVDFVLKEFT